MEAKQCIELQKSDTKQIKVLPILRNPWCYTCPPSMGHFPFSRPGLSQGRPFKAKPIFPKLKPNTPLWKAFQSLMPTLPHHQPNTPPRLACFQVGAIAWAIASLRTARKWISSWLLCFNLTTIHFKVKSSPKGTCTRMAGDFLSTPSTKAGHFALKTPTKVNHSMNLDGMTRIFQ